MVGACLCLLLLAASVHSDRIVVKDMQHLLKVESQLVQNFRNYAKQLQSKLRVIKSALAEYSEHVNAANKNNDLYLANVLTAFRLKRHMHHDWSAWQLYMEELGHAQIEMQRRLLSLTPKRGALKEAAQSLQETFKFYNYEPVSFLSSQSVHLRLSPLDCYYMGVELNEQQLYHEAAEWLAVAAENYTTSPHDELLDVPHWQIYELHSQVLINLNKQVEARFALKRAIDLAPDNPQLLQKLELINVIPTVEESSPAPAVSVSKLQQRCMGNYKPDLGLFCELNQIVSPFLQLAPLRLEEVLDEPLTMIYKDVIHENEILHIRNAFERCPSTAKFEAAVDIQGCSISDNYSPLTKQLAVRILDMTGLNKPMPNIFVLEYGPRAVFKLFELAKLNKVNLEDIEATAVMFLNDVELGGAITMTNTELAVFPRRGEALITFHDGVFEHTMCPNVVGNRLIVVKFLYVED